MDETEARFRERLLSGTMRWPDIAAWARAVEPDAHLLRPTIQALIGEIRALDEDVRDGTMAPDDARRLVRRHPLLEQR